MSGAGLSLKRCGVWLMTFLLLVPAVANCQNTPANPPNEPQTQTENPATSPGDSSAPADPQNTAPNPNAAPPPAQSPNTNLQKPLGTAAAPPVEVTGVAASRPEGAALAPAKQRRVRRLIISLSLVAAGAVALGATLALTAASPGRPPGSK